MKKLTFPALASDTMAEQPPEACSAVTAAMDILFDETDVRNHNRIAQLCLINCVSGCRLGLQLKAHNTGIELPPAALDSKLSDLVCDTIEGQMNLHDGLIGTLSRGERHVKGVIETHMALYRERVPQESGSWASPSITDGAYQLIAEFVEGNLRVALAIVSKLVDVSRAMQLDHVAEPPQQLLVLLSDPMVIKRADIQALWHHETFQQWARLAMTPRGEIFPRIS